MADRRRGESKQLKKDQTIRRETLDEIGSEIVEERGDEDRSRELETEGDDGLGPKSNR
jgi:hypothetical protein